MKSVELYILWLKKIKLLKKVYNNAMNSIMLIHSKWIPYLYIKSTKTCDPSRLLFNISDQLNLEKSDKYLALLNLSI